MAPNIQASDWRILAELASKEMDPSKLAVLVGQLCIAMDRERANGKGVRNASLPSIPRSAEMMLVRQAIM
jgi:hypothetical protein